MVGLWLIICEIFHYPLVIKHDLLENHPFTVMMVPARNPHAVQGFRELAITYY